MMLLLFVANIDRSHEVMLQFLLASQAMFFGFTEERKRVPFTINLACVYLYLRVHELQNNKTLARQLNWLIESGLHSRAHTLLHEAL